MLEAQYNLQTAPIQYKKATQAYLTYTKGAQEFETYQEQQLYEQANKTCEKVWKEMLDKIQRLQTDLVTNTNIENNYDYIKDLLQKYETENTMFVSNIYSTSSDVITNERKTYYEDQVINKQKIYTIFLSWLYILMLFLYVLTALFTNVKIPFYKHILVFFGFVLYYLFIKKYLESIVIIIMKLYLDWLPKNVYVNLQNKDY